VLFRSVVPKTANTTTGPQSSTTFQICCCSTPVVLLSVAGLSASDAMENEAGLWEI